LFLFLATCDRLSWILNFRLHVKLFYRIVSHLATIIYNATASTVLRRTTCSAFARKARRLNFVL